MQRNRRQLFSSWHTIMVWLNIPREMHMHRSVYDILNLFGNVLETLLEVYSIWKLFQPFLVIVVSIPGCYWHWWCIQKCWGCQPCHSRGRRKDYSTTRANSWTQHQDYRFPGSRWLENCKFSLVLITWCLFCLFDFGNTAALKGRNSQSMGGENCLVTLK